MVFGFEIEHLHNVSSWCYVLWFVIGDMQDKGDFLSRFLWLPFFGMTCVARITKSSRLGFV